MWFSGQHYKSTHLVHLHKPSKTRRKLYTANQRKMKRFGVISCTDMEKWGFSEAVVSRYIDYYKAKTDGNDAEWIGFHATRGQIPVKEELHTFDGFVMSGSLSSANDNDVWIKKLEEFVKQVAELNSNGKQIKLVGICFGHQIMARALGGRVGLNPNKEFVLLTELIKITDEGKNAGAIQGLFDDGPLRAVESHSECITELPKGATTLASSESCQHEIVQFSDDIIGLQCHPEVLTSEANELILPSISAAYKWDNDRIEKTSQSFQLKCDDDRLNYVIARFLNQLQ